MWRARNPDAIHVRPGTLAPDAIDRLRRGCARMGVALTLGEGAAPPGAKTLSGTGAMRLESDSGFAFIPEALFDDDAVFWREWLAELFRCL